MNESLKDWNAGGWVRVDFAKKLEQERDEARTTIEDAKRALNATDYEGILFAAMRVKEERDEARAALKTNEVVVAQQNVITDLILEKDKIQNRCNDLEQAMSYSSGATTLLSRFLKVLNERNDLVQKLDAWQEIAEHLHHLVQHPAYGVEQAIRRMDILSAYKHMNDGR